MTLRYLFLKEFDINYYKVCQRYKPEFVQVYKVQFEQVFESNLMNCQSLFISSQNAIKGLLYHHINSINNDCDVYIVGPKTASYFEDCFSKKPTVVANSAQALVDSIKQLNSKVKEPILFVTGHIHSPILPEFFKDKKSIIAPIYSTEYLIDTSYFTKYDPINTILIVFAPEMAKRIPKLPWKGIVSIGEATHSSLALNCPKFIAKTPTPEGIYDQLAELNSI